VLSPDDDRDPGEGSDAEPDPPDLGPDAPSVDAPSVGDTSDSLTPPEDVDPEIRRTFWQLVVVVDVALLALSLGPMFIYFEGDVRRGLLLIAFGVAVSAYGVRKYRNYRAGRDDADEASDSDSATPASDGGDRQG
jgi:hypothetical protein